MLTIKPSNVLVPSWIACRSYLVDTPQSRTIISNNKTHETLLLEGLSSDLYAFLAAHDIIQWKKLLDFSIKKNITDEIEGFIYELNRMQYLAFGDDPEETPRAYPIYQQNSPSSNEGPTVEKDMQEWCKHNGLLWSIFLELTYKCNLHCIHCYNPENRGTAEISFEKAKEIIDDAVELGCFEITLSGGECTLDSDFFAICDYVKSKRLNLKIYTNGISLFQNKKSLDKLISYYPCTVGISIYSADNEQHDLVTTAKGSWKKSVAVLENLQSHGIQTQVKSPQLAETIKSWDKTIEFSRQFDRAATFDITLTPTIEGNTKTYHHKIPDDELLTLFKNPKSPLYVGNWEVPPEIDIDRDGPCSAGTYGLVITPWLSIRPCVSIPLDMGSVANVRLKEIWKEGINNPETALYKWRNLTLRPFSECFKEEYCKFCNFCPAMGMLEDKLFSKSLELCRVAKLKMQAFLSLKEDEVQTGTPYRDNACKMQ